jgi:UDP-glucose 4-epimerase
VDRIENISQKNHNFSFVNADVCDTNALERLFSQRKIHGIYHLAALKSVTDSFADANKYIENNHLASMNLIKLAIKFGINNIVFTSSAAVYGDGSGSLISETLDPNPTSPYGESKLLTENFLNAEIKKGNVRGSSLRCFNVIGTKNRALSDISGTNLVPLTLAAIKKKQRPVIFGGEYPTPDGTCIRDYIDVRDVIDAHILAMETMKEKEIESVINVGSGAGHSVLELVTEVIELSASNLSPQIVGKRDGDPIRIVADVALAKKDLEFQSSIPFRDSILSAVEAYRW